MATDPPPPRTRSVRLTLVSLLLIPLLSLAALWGFIASITLGNVIRDQQYNRVENAIAPSVIALAQTLAGERALTLIWLGTGRQSAPFQAQLQAVRHSTDTYAAAVRSSIMSVDGLVSTTARTRFGQFLAELAGLGQIRAAVDSGADSQAAAYNAYSAITAAEYGAFQISLPPGDPDLSLMTQSAIAEGRAEDYTGGAVALVEGALAARGLMPQPDRVLLAETVGQQNLEIGNMYSLADPAMTAIFKQIYDTPAYHRLAGHRELRSRPARPTGRYRSIPRPSKPPPWRSRRRWWANERQIGNLLAAQSRTLSDGLQTQLYLAGGLGLAALLASVFVMVRFGRRLRVELTQPVRQRQANGQRAAAAAGRAAARRRGRRRRRRSPRRCRRAGSPRSRRSRRPSPPCSAPPSRPPSARPTCARASTRSSSTCRCGTSRCCTGSSACSTPWSAPPATRPLLGDLFRLDHLTTRMRRHAESLLILAGTTPGRGWRDPVPVVDVLQAAVAEVEDYVRVDVITESADAVAGTAVNDVIHLIAELVENATAFSPPNTRVEISGDVVGHGFAVEIEDRGLGIAPDELAAINEQLASPPEFDLASSDQLGLFVAGQLAARHGIRVSLRMSPYGGTTAIVLLPRQIIVPEDECRRLVQVRRHRRAADGGRERLSAVRRWDRDRPAIRRRAASAVLADDGWPADRLAAGPRGAAGGRCVPVRGAARRPAPDRPGRRRPARRRRSPDRRRAAAPRPGPSDPRSPTAGRLASPGLRSPGPARPTRDGRRRDLPGPAPAGPPGQPRPAASRSARRRARHRPPALGRAAESVGTFA